MLKGYLHIDSSLGGYWYTNSLKVIVSLIKKNATKMLGYSKPLFLLDFKR